MFCEFVYSKSDPDVLVLPLLQLLYTHSTSTAAAASGSASAAGSAGEGSSLRTSRVYMASIILLILSEVCVMMCCGMGCDVM
jgi:hypothetical protein